MGAMATSGNSAQFTYDFGIAIAQSTVNKLVRLTGATLSLASAFYALRQSADAYVHTLRENTLAFGGVLSTMKAMEQAQDRLIKGQTFFSVDDQLKGMRQLMSVGVDVGKNIEWISKAAHATGKSYAEFSGMIASAIQGNASALVNAGLMTQRATRMFDKYAANTVMRQQAILNFVKNHKGLMNAIKNDFITIQDGMLRLNTVFKSFLTSIVGKPNDPNSLYGTVSRVLTEFGDKFGKDGVLTKNMIALRNYGKGVGIVMSWVVRQVGSMMLWLSRQAKKVTTLLLGSSDTFADRMRSLVVWLEFWKQAVVHFFKEYSSEIKGALKLVLTYKALKYTFIIGSAAIKSVAAYRAALLGAFALQSRYIRRMDRTGIMGRFSGWLASLSAFMPKGFRKLWNKAAKLLGSFEARLRGRAPFIAKSFIGAIGAAMLSSLKLLKAPFKTLAWALRPITKFVFAKNATGGFINSIIASLKSIARFIVSPIKLIMLMRKGVVGLWSAVVLAKGGFQALFTLFKVSNPVGWLILAVTLLATLYAKSKNFRVLINNIFKFMWEALKLVYNLIVGAVVYAIVGCKKAWKAFRDYVWKPLASFFSSAWKWIGDMWKKFMNTSVGRWINDHIVSPLKSVFEWVVKAWKWVLKAIGKAVEFLSGANSDLAKNINELAKAEGLESLAVATKGGNYDTKDDTNYVSRMFNVPNEAENVTSTQGGNPLLSESTFGNKGTRKESTTNMAFNRGAIQIIVQKGDAIDENKLARQVRQVILDMKREGSMRGGMV